MGQDVAGFCPVQEVGERCEVGCAEVEGLDGFRRLVGVTGGDRDRF